MNTHSETNRLGPTGSVEVNDARNFVADVFVRVTNFFCRVLARQDVVNALLVIIAACAVGNIDRNFAGVIGELRAPVRNFFHGSDPHFSGVRGDFGIQILAHAKRGDGVAIVDDEALAVVVFTVVPLPDVMIVTHRG